MFGLIAATFVLMMWVIGSPDSYRQHIEQFASTTGKWPDGSDKTAQDWWAKPGSKPPTQVAQPPTPAPQKPPKVDTAQEEGAGQWTRPEVQRRGEELRWFANVGRRLMARRYRWMR